MNAETRAKETPADRVAKDIVDAIFMSGSQWGEHDWEYAQTIIAQAITRAQNDKLEEAALAAEMLTLVHPIAGGIAQNIRSLKSKD